jgi:AraC-like DNA-binding protein
MVRALRQYGRWLRDNYADLEHKEVWQSFVVLAIMLLVFVAYALTSEGPVYVYAMLVISVVFLCYILWRVETLSDLSIPLSQGQCVAEPATIMAEDVEGNGLSQAMRENFRALLQQHCIDTQLYLQHDLNLSQLAKAIGTNRFYLSQYFSSQGTTYNAYINDLRISHFESLYRETDASQRSITAQQLAQESGYRSYSTFCSIIKRKTGMSVTAWMKALHDGLGEP